MEQNDIRWLQRLDNYERALLQIMSQLDNLDLANEIDLSLKHTIHSQALLEHIQRVGQVIYQKPEA